MKMKWYDAIIVATVHTHWISQNNKTYKEAGQWLKKY